MKEAQRRLRTTWTTIGVQTYPVDGASASARGYRRLDDEPTDEPTTSRPTRPRGRRTQDVDSMRTPLPPQQAQQQRQQAPPPPPPPQPPPHPSAAGSYQRL